jgi:DNA adenine methylase
MTSQIANCPDCGCNVGEPHYEDCDVERCSICGSQRVSCAGCPGHDPLESAWTGEWPETQRSVRNLGRSASDRPAREEGPTDLWADKILNDLYCCISPEDIGLSRVDGGPGWSEAAWIRGLCPDCGCGEGEFHRQGCQIERCSVCHDQLDACGGCKGHDRRLSVWRSKPTIDSVPVPEYSPTIRQKTSKRQPRRAKPAKSLVRYPGGKQGMIEPILARLTPMFDDLGPEAEYREPFLGGGAVAIAVLKYHPDRPAWLNDADPCLATLWECVMHQPDALMMLVEELNHVLDEKYFYLFQRELRSIRTPADLDRYGPCWVALAKLGVHLMSYSGLGTRAGGPMGGRQQWKPYSIRSRYNPARISSTIDEFRSILGTRLREGTCTCLPFERLFEPGEAVLYFDPPYIKAGPDLYQLGFNLADHERLASLLKRETRPWLLSYDDHPVIRDLYHGWTRIEEVEMKCSINGSNTKSELLISSF